MGKSQHVTPHSKGGWQVKVQETPKQLQEQLLKPKRYLLLKALPLIKNPSWLYMAQMVEFAKKIHMAMILFRLEAKT